MTIQVNNMLTKSRNPSEHEFTLENETGEVVHRLDDGYNLIRFRQFYLRELRRVDKKKKWMLVPLDWYIHNEDLKII